MNGKGDKPRNCFSKQFKDNHDAINWNRDYYWVLEHGRPLGLQNDIFVGSNKQADEAKKRERGPHNPYGTTFRKFNTYKEAEEFIRSHVQNKELNQVLIPPRRFQERRS